MARGNITEEDLAAGIKSVGVLSAVTGPSGQRRDNPFGGPTPAKPSLPEKRIDPAPNPTPEVAPPPPAPATAQPEQRVVATGKADVYTDYITLPITAKMRGSATTLAAELQRRRTEKALRFSANVLFRTAIEVILDDFELGPDDRANSIDELKALLRSKLNTQGSRSRRS